MLNDFPDDRLLPIAHPQKLTPWIVSESLPLRFLHAATRAMNFPKIDRPQDAEPIRELGDGHGFPAKPQNPSTALGAGPISLPLLSNHRRTPSAGIGLGVGVHSGLVQRHAMHEDAMQFEPAGRSPSSWSRFHDALGTALLDVALANGHHLPLASSSVMRCPPWESRECARLRNHPTPSRPT